MLSFTVFIAHRPCICPAPRPLPVRRSLHLLRLDRGPGRASPGFLTSLPLCVIPPNHWPFLFMRLRTLSFSVACKPFVCHSYENNRGVAQLFPFWNAALATHLFPMYLSSFFSSYSKLFCTREKHNSFIFKRFHTLCKKHRGVGEQFDAYPSLPSARAESRSQPPLRLRLLELCVLCGLCVNSDSLLNFQLWIEDPDPVGTVNLLCAALPRVTEHTSHCHPRGRQCYHQSETRDIPL